LRTVLKKLGAKPLPRVSNENVFNASEYAEAVGLSLAGARLRIRKLIQNGLVRRVRDAENGFPAFEWVGK